VDALDRGPPPNDARFRWFRNQSLWNERLALKVVQYTLEDLREALAKEDAPQMHGATGPERVAELAKARVAAVMRDIFGNPFRPVHFSPDWRTESVLALARRAYAGSDFSAMPILADALEDAGCDNAELLGHLRGPGKHVRGCWAVDLVLAKE
jgi:hypothetical protein